MKLKTKIAIALCFIFIIFFGCKEFKEHNVRINEIKVITIQGDTVIIQSHGSGHVIILPIDYETKIN